MVGIRKIDIAQGPASAEKARTQKQQEQLAREAAFVDHAAEIAIMGLQASKKRERYAQDLGELQNLDSSFRGEIAYRPIGNKKLTVTAEGEITRERGAFSKTRKVTRFGEDGGVYVARREKDSRRKTETLDFDESGKLQAKHVVGKDGSFEESWQRDEQGNLVRTNYFTSRKRDGRILRAVSEKMSDPFERDGKVYRELTRTKGSKKEIFLRDESGKLELVERATPRSLTRTVPSRDHKTSKTDVVKGKLFAESYVSRLDPNGQEIGRDTESLRRLFDKKSANYDKETGAMTAVKHTVGKLYKSNTTYVGDNRKVVSRKVFGLKLATKLQRLSEGEKEAQSLRLREANEHRSLWADKAAVAPLEVAARQLTPRVSGSRSSVSKSTQSGASTPRTSVSSIYSEFVPDVLSSRLSQVSSRSFYSDEEIVSDRGSEDIAQHLPKPRDRADPDRVSGVVVEHKNGTHSGAPVKGRLAPAKGIASPATATISGSRSPRHEHESPTKRATPRPKEDLFDPDLAFGEGAVVENDVREPAGIGMSRVQLSARDIDELASMFIPPPPAATDAARAELLARDRGRDGGRV